MLPLETTPKAITPQISALCNRLAPDEISVYINVRAPEWAEPDNCVYNVPRYIADNGGERILGWCIWERPRINLHAEFHAIWRSPRGELLDVTPKPDGETKILFLVDRKLQWEGLRIGPHFVPLSHRREVREYLAAQERYKKMLQPGVNELEAAQCEHAEHEVNRTIRNLLKLLKRRSL